MSDVPQNEDQLMWRAALMMLRNRGDQAPVRRKSGKREFYSGDVLGIKDFPISDIDLEVNVDQQRRSNP